MKYVIIGASAAGMQAAEDIRALDLLGEITVISAEKHYPYSRCLISRYVEGILPAEGLCFKTNHFFRDRNVVGLLDTRVEAIDPLAKQVRLASGQALPYDRLLLATGSRPFVPRIPGTQTGRVYPFHSMEDAERIADAAQAARTAVVLGAGFAGLEAAYALARRGIKVTVVEKMGQILPNQLDWAGSQIIHGDLTRSGVHILLNTSVSTINGEANVSSVTLTDNTSLMADLVVLATGIRANKELAEQAGLATNRGVVVNENMQTSNPDIYAAGDVIEIEDISTGKRVSSATWFNAVVQGKYAAFNMTGRKRVYSEAVGIQNAVQFHRVPAISFGQTLVGGDDQEEYEIMTLQKADVYKKLVLKDNILCGMIFVGDIGKAGFYAALIRHRVDLSAVRDRLLDDDFSYAAVLGQHTFGQKNPYSQTAPEWEDAHSFWAARPRAVGIVRG
jgi:nitrite reductase (NADH) large subunit